MADTTNNPPPLEALFAQLQIDIEVPDDSAYEEQQTGSEINYEKLLTRNAKLKYVNTVVGSIRVDLPRKEYPRDNRLHRTEEYWSMFAQPEPVNVASLPGEDLYMEQNKRALAQTALSRELFRKEMQRQNQDLDATIARDLGEIERHVKDLDETQERRDRKKTIRAQIEHMIPIARGWRLRRAGRSLGIASDARFSTDRAEGKSGNEVALRPTPRRSRLPMGAHFGQ